MMRVSGDYIGIIRLLWLLRIESGIHSVGELPGPTATLVADLRTVVRDRIISSASEVDRIVKSLASGGELSAEIAAFVVWQSSVRSEEARSVLVHAGALPDLVALLVSK